MARDDYDHLPILANQFPLHVKGLAKWTEFTGSCGTCKKPIPTLMMRGIAERPFSEGPWIITAYGWCADCQAHSQYHFRLMPDMSLMGVQNGKWVTWDSRGPNKDTERSRPLRGYLHSLAWPLRFGLHLVALTTYSVGMWHHNTLMFALGLGALHWAMLYLCGAPNASISR